MPIPPQTQILPRTTAKERVYQTLRQWIINGTLQPRERLNDVELARYFSVSRTPVREALQLLSEKKLVQIVPSSGTYVAPIDDQDMAHVYQLLVALQSLALELCIRTITPEQLERLEELNEHFSRCCAPGRRNRPARPTTSSTSTSAACRATPIFSAFRSSWNSRPAATRTGSSRRTPSRLKATRTTAASWRRCGRGTWRGPRRN